MAEEICLAQWKGTSTMEIGPDNSSYVVLEHRKNKDGALIEVRHVIPEKNVQVLWHLISESRDTETVFGYLWLVRKVVEHYQFHEFESLSLEQMMTAFNGGKYRAKYYFPHLYYPLKILEAKGLIEYFGRGGIRLKVNIHD